VQGEPVTFSVVAGGGMVFGGSVLSDADGLARPSRWMLGPNAGANTLRATMRTVTADFAATAAAPSPFNMVLRYINVPTRRQQDAFEAAWLRWRSIITGDLSDLDFASQPLAGPCSGVNQTLNELVDDLIIYVNLAPIDGPGQVLGSAGPCRLRNSNLIPGVGVMTFDTADLPNLDAQGQLNNVILHEMGHVLGIGTIWGSQYKNLLNGGGTDSSSFDGVQAKGAWQSFGGLPAGSRVPVENCVGLTNCGAGTRDGHWRELVFRTELMTGYLNGGGPNPLSRLTILSLQDLGYQVDVSLADNYALPTSIEAGNGVRGAITSAGPLIAMIEAPLPEPIVVDARGRSLGPVSEWRRRQFR
jgi:hypothetical protein